MRVVVIGDISWRTQYHLGDEAMTEVAIQELRKRGITDIRLIAGDPTVAEKFYGLPAVPRNGFHGTWSRDQLDRAMEASTDALTQPVDTARGYELRALIKQADAVVIAGGGNMNSVHVHHLYERAAVTRTARHYGKPLFVTSQTVGPRLRPRDIPYVQEILGYATCFGARDAQTYQLLLELGGDQDRVVLGHDDALLLSPLPQDEAFADAIAGERAFAIGSFASKADPWENVEVAEHLASTLDELVARFDLDVLLVPHVGSLDRSVLGSDQVLNGLIAERSETGRLRSMPMLTARQAIALTARAAVSLSTRYHPTVFSPMVGTPAVGLAGDLYTSSRMVGALAPFGLDDFCVTEPSWEMGVLPEVVASALEPRVRQHVATTAPIVRREQEVWWDHIVEAIRGVWTPPSAPTFASRLEGGSWSLGVIATRLMTERLGRMKSEHCDEVDALTRSLESAETQLERARKDLAVAREEVARQEEISTALSTQVDSLQEQRAALEASLTAARNRKAARAADAVARAVHLLPRPRRNA